MFKKTGGSTTGEKRPSSSMITNPYSEISSTDHVINYQHVPCFSSSTAAAPSGFNYHSLFDGGLPPPLMADPTSSSSMSSSTTFPDLRSLEENLNLHHQPNHFFFPAVTAGNIYASDTSNNFPAMETQKAGLTELDCIWRGSLN